MKKIRLVITVALFLVSATMQAQTKLPDSSRGSSKRYVYAIDKDNLRKIYLKDEELTEDMLGHYITDYPIGQPAPKLPRGNYMVVNVVENKLNISDCTVDDLYFKVVPSEDMMLCLYDSLGNIIADATVKCGAKTLKFDATTQTYNTKSVKDEQVIEINYREVYHYIEIEKPSPYPYYYYPPKNKWWHIKRSQKDKYTGFVVFSKPKYKPGETVKLKGYVAELDGTPCNKPVDIRLYSYYPTKVDTILTHVEPYRSGMYEYQFELSDKLNLTLDANYNIELKTGNKHHNAISGNFRYEDYELKGIRFSMTTDKTEYAKGDSVQVKFKVTDENEMAVYDGKIELLVESRPVNYNRVKSQPQGFVPDTLWTYTLPLEGTSEREVVLPDSIFPNGISVDYEISATYLSSSNEKKTVYKRLSRLADDHILDFSLKKGMLTIKELHKGKSQQVMADVRVEGRNHQVILAKSVMLPYSMPLPWFAVNVVAKTSHATDRYLTNQVREEQLDPQFYRRNDSVYLKVDNPAEIPFWYVIRRNNSEIAEGYTTTLDYAVRDNKQGYTMQLRYFLGEKERYVERTLPFVEKNISMKVSTPTAVYPGQTTDVEITVTDKKGKPVNNVDITAYAYTSKFESNQMPGIAVRGKGKYAKNITNIRYGADKDLTVDKKTPLTWKRWKDTMTLDTIAYYNFLYPETYYVYTEPTADEATLISPYIVINGALQAIHILWIDNRLYYTSVAEQKSNYTFQVEPGIHTLRFRTYDREVSVNNVYVTRGAKNIFSFNAGKSYVQAESMNEKYNQPLTISSQLLERKEWGTLTNKETQYLSEQLITIDNNFGSIRLPDLHHTMDIPGYIKSGDTYYYINHIPRTRYDQTIRGQVNVPVLVGPFPKRNVINRMANMASVYLEKDSLVSLIEIEGGNRYTVYPGYQKIKNWNKPVFSQELEQYMYVRNFREKPLTVNDILRHSEKQLLSVIKKSYGPVLTNKMEDSNTKTKCQLNLLVGKDTQGNSLKPALIFIAPQERGNIGRNQLYYGATRNFTSLPAGKVKVSLIMNDSTSYTRLITLRPYGQNFLNFDSIQCDAEKRLSQNIFNQFTRRITKEYTRNPYAVRHFKDSVMLVGKQDTGKYNSQNAQQGIITGIVRDNNGEPIIGVTVRIVGTPIATVTDLDGYFKLSGGSNGSKIEVSFIGYAPQSLKYQEGYEYTVEMEENYQALEEVVVVGYGAQKRYDLTGSVQGIATSDFFIRGMSTGDSGSPLILVNGLPFDGSINDIDPASILSLDILKDATATAVYGSRGANGVVMIQTNALGANLKAAQTDDGFPVMEAGNVMRRNFHDDAFWQPRLTTNKEGKASFEVTYPDDITSWDTYFVAVGNKKQTDKQRMTVRSFKALAATLSTPRFAVRGDSINAVGKIANHMGDTISVSRHIEIGQQMQKEDITLASSHIDYIPVTATVGDSITIAYSIQKTNGYFDGEERSFPIIEQGMLQTYGEFKVLNDTTTSTFAVNPELGTVTINAEASSLEVFLREIEKVDSYPYMCNEQMASKIKALLSKKQIAGMFGKEFKEDKKINNLISRLNKNKNTDGLWGWWNKSKTERWISRQVVSALLAAEAAGYKSDLNKTRLTNDLVAELKTGLSNLSHTTPNQIPYAKQELLERLINLKHINATIEYKDYFKQINEQLPSRTLTDKLKTMEAMVTIGLKNEINMDSLMHYSRKTMLGSIFWGDAGEIDLFYRGFILPYNNNTDHTLVAYRILKAVGGYDKEMEKVRNYFFERRRGGAWNNIYEASRIIETIMPDVLTSEQAFTEVTMTLNGRKITKFPFTEQRESMGTVQIKKEGTAPVFVSVYQQSWNPRPVPESAKGFTVKSVFKGNGSTLSYLTSGKTAQMEVRVVVEADAEYVQIEVPIPAGCSYDSKAVGNYWKEAHREHFKDKVVIFSNKLSKGDHTFTIDLIPRYTGKYTLNPAKVELMYFPVFYGNEEIRRVEIRE